MTTISDAQRPVYVVAELADAYTQDDHDNRVIFYLRGESSATGLPEVHKTAAATSFEVMPDQPGNQKSTVSVQLKGLVRVKDSLYDPVNNFYNLK